MAAPFLTNLGITAIQQARTPTPDTFPLTFNPNNKSLWQQAVYELVPSDPVIDWVTTIQRYVALCETRGTYPFQSVQQSRNDQISDFLRDSRRAFVKFIDRTDFFAGVKLRTTDRKVVITDKGFVLTVSATANISDPSFEKWLIEMPFPRFDLVKKEGRHWKTLQTGLRMFAYRDHGSNSPERWVVGYEITCPIYPDLPDQHLPSKQQLEKFVLDILWMPHLRAMRPKKMLHRLI